MPVPLEQYEFYCLIRMEGHITLACAGELRKLLLDWLATGKSLELNLERAEDIDITAMQLLWTAAREAAREGVGIVARATGAVAATVRDSGFAQAPGFPVPE